MREPGSSPNGRTPWLWKHNPHPDGIDRQRGCVGNPEPSHQLGPTLFDGLGADEKQISDFLFLAALSSQLEHIFFGSSGFSVLLGVEKKVDHPVSPLEVLQDIQRKGALMSTRFLDHAFVPRRHGYRSSGYENGQIGFTVEMNPGAILCSVCKIR